ncbi:hypothetical protein Tco_1562538 [Tanacetum coccineum]
MGRNVTLDPDITTNGIAGRSQAPEKVTVTDLFYLRGMDVGSVNVPYLLARLLTAEILIGLTVIAPKLLIIDMGELAPPPPPDHARTMPQRKDRLEEDVHEMCRAFTEQREVIDVMAHDFSRFSTWAFTGLAWMMDRAYKSN